jgi:deoxyadenosine/deoxycytidine kinase
VLNLHKNKLSIFNNGFHPLKNLFKQLALLLFFFFSLTTELSAGKKGKVIAFSGLSCTGKSTMAKEIAKELSAQCLLEPEEENWPSMCHKGEEFGPFTMFMGFREMWLPHLYTAQKLKNENELVFLDTFFIKTTLYELDAPGMEWLFDPKDPYYSVFREVCTLDIEYLPDPDCIVFFKLDEKTWKKFLAARPRDWDQIPGFLDSFEQSYEAIQCAIIRLCQERNIPLIRFQQEYGDITTQVLRLKSELIQAGVIETLH